MSQSKLAPKRALSLEDLVHHDDRLETPIERAPKPLPSEEIKKRLSVDELSGSDHQGNSEAHERHTSDTRYPDDETDTDDDAGNGGDVVFGNGNFKFNYDEQEKQAKDEVREPPEETDAVGEGTPPKIEESHKKDLKAAEIHDIFQEKSSLQSKRNAIKKDLNLLKEIAVTAKPSRYKVAPVWAQKWRPTVKALQNVNPQDLKIDASFTNIIPDDDLTKSVQDWVYATIVSIPPDQRQYIEMEMKFGIIVEGSDSNRVNPPVSSQSVYTEIDGHLTPDVDQRVFEELNKYVKGLSELSEYTGKFNMIESHTVDSLYRVGLSTQRPRFLRMSRDLKTDRVGEFIEKRHISQLLLYSPKDSYDVKISINLELPVPENDPPEKFKNQTPVNTRTKDRISYIHNDSCTRMDITKVANHNQGVKQRHTETTHEVELEVNTASLLSAFENIATDSKTYAAILRTFLNNGTIIRRKLTSLSYEIFEGQKKA
ncbi:LAMI_0C02894g1_1 [Lachancea mirantina]|uniref:mRNA-capping enzyme subunit beta n=1 Tax=Lachancea mirantina TaxID=1230905 RepID=A0A1G4J199_9SACH|nr:LAMI_0C02894g1_1 [Lachancea mirantina]